MNKDTITYDLLLQYTSEYDIFSYYLGIKFKLGQLIKSPLRIKDKNPSFNIFYSRLNDKLMFKDFGNGSSGDVISFVKLLRNLSSRKETLKYVYEEIIEYKIKPSTKGIVINSLKKDKEYKDITVKRAKFNPADLSYWEDFNITEDILNTYKVNHITYAWINEVLTWTYNKTNPLYSYRIYNRFKLYKPLSKNGKFLTNCRPIDMQGFEQLPNKGQNLIITKSLKDVMVLYSLGYTAMAPHSESCYIDKKIIENINKRFKNIYLFYDNDAIGQEWSDKLSKEYNYHNIHIPETYNQKDISDFIKQYKLNDTEELMKELLKDNS